MIFNKISFEYGNFINDSLYTIKVNGTSSIPLKFSNSEFPLFIFNPAIEISVNNEPINFEIFTYKNDLNQIGNLIMEQTGINFVLTKDQYLINDSLGIFPKEINLFFNNSGIGKVNPTWF
jgi:hypothetical protein